MAKNIITIRPRYWHANLGFVGLASGLVVMIIIQALTTPNVEIGIGMVLLVGMIISFTRGLNKFIRLTETSLIIKHSGQPVTIDWGHVAGVGTLQGVMGITMPYLILRQPYPNLPEPNLRRLTNANLRDEILIINPLQWNNIAKLWPLILQQLPPTNEYQVPFDFSAAPRVERRMMGIFGGITILTLILVFWFF